MTSKDLKKQIFPINKTKKFEQKKNTANFEIAFNRTF